MTAGGGPERPGGRRVRLVSVDGGPTPDQRAAIEAAVERIIEHDRAARRASLWLRAGRAQGRRLGMYDYRDRFAAEDAWRLSARFPAGGREYQGRLGRGDTR